MISKHSHTKKSPQNCFSELSNLEYFLWLLAFPSIFFVIFFCNIKHSKHQLIIKGYSNISYLMFWWQVEFWLAKKVLLKLQGRVGWQKINNRSHLCAVHLHCAQQTTHISQDDRKSIIALCDLCPIIHISLSKDTVMFFLY